jgi:hypothetical protein
MAARRPRHCGMCNFAVPDDQDSNDIKRSFFQITGNRSDRCHNDGIVVLSDEERSK